MSDTQNYDNLVSQAAFDAIESILNAGKAITEATGIFAEPRAQSHKDFARNLKSECTRDGWEDSHAMDYAEGTVEAATSFLDEMTELAPKKKELLDEISGTGQRGRISDMLEEAVLRWHDQRARRINDEGLEAQVDFLLRDAVETGGVEDGAELIQLEIDQALGKDKAESPFDGMEKDAEPA